MNRRKQLVIPILVTSVLGLSFLSCSEENALEARASTSNFHETARQVYLNQFRTDVQKSDRRRLMTDEEIRALPVEFFGLPFPDGTVIFAGEHNLGDGDPGEIVGFRIPPKMASEFINGARSAWESLHPNPASYEKTTETVQHLYGGNHDNFGSQYTEKTVIMQFTSEAPLKKRWIDLYIDPVSGNGVLSWTRP